MQSAEVNNALESYCSKLRNFNSCVKIFSFILCQIPSIMQENSCIYFQIELNISHMQYVINENKRDEVKKQ